MSARPAKTSRILIVDDEEDFARTLASRLELRGMATVCAFDGESGLAAVEREAPAVLLLDMRMPGLSGVDVLARLRRGAVPGREDTPVIIVTGHCSETDAARAEELGIQGYHSKPLDFDALLASIAELESGGTRT